MLCNDGNSTELPQFNFQDLPTNVAIKMYTKYKMQYGDGDIIYVMHLFYSAT